MNHRTNPLKKEKYMSTENVNTMYSVLLTLDTPTAKLPLQTYYTESLAAYYNKIIASTIVKAISSGGENSMIYAINCSLDKVDYMMDLALEYNKRELILVNQETRVASVVDPKTGAVKSTGKWEQAPTMAAAADIYVKAENMERPLAVTINGEVYYINEAGAAWL